MLQFLINTVDTLVQEHHGALSLFLLVIFGFYICENGIPLHRTIITKTTEKTERREE